MLSYTLHSFHFDAKYDLSRCSANWGKSITVWLPQSNPVFAVVFVDTFVAVLVVQSPSPVFERLLFFPTAPQRSPFSIFDEWHFRQNAKTQTWVGLKIFPQQKILILFLFQAISFPVGPAASNSSSLLFLFSLVNRVYQGWTWGLLFHSYRLIHEYDNVDLWPSILNWSYLVEQWLCY